MRDALGSIRSVLLLGGSSEIGLATAEMLVRQRGATKVVLAGRDRTRMEVGAEGLERAGAEVAFADFDAEAVDTHEGSVERVWQEHGDIDVTIVAFGVLGDQAVAEKDPSAAVHIATVNYTGAVSVGLHVANRIDRQGHGAMVVLSSVAGERARRANFVYGSSKAGLDAFAQGLGDRLAKGGGHVLVVRPGFVHTRMTEGMDPAPFSTTPEAVAHDIVRALDRRAHTVHSPNVLRWVMTVLRHLPRALFRLLPR
jgi:decaprenylphospho-beta-D-erythro-pentofuranosid-2-ulose 2-reductase